MADAPMGWMKKSVLRRLLPWASVSAFVLCGFVGTVGAVLVDDFEGASSPAPWIFSNGAEFPGATGSLSRGAGYTGYGAHLAYDMSAGGNYVAAIDWLPTPVTAARLLLWVKSPGGMRVQVRVNDSTGQTLQYTPDRPFEAADAQQWYLLSVDLGPTTDHWGGSVNDGTVHGAITGVSIMAQAGTNKVGAIDFDDVQLVDAAATVINPATAPATPAAVTKLNASLGVEITHADATATGLNLVQTLGFARVRTEMFWADVETAAGVYDFSWYDQLVASLKTRGVSTHFILCYGNPLYTGNGWFSPPLTSGAIAAFGNFAQAAAAHYAGQGVRFEVWNEPDIAGFWNPPDPAMYSALSRVAIARVHLGDPSALVVTGGLAGIDLAFLDAILADGGATGANGIGLHPYRLENPEGLASDLLGFRGHIAAGSAGAPPPVWSTEAGYSSAWYGDGSLAANRITQAKFSVRQILTGLALGLPSQNFFALRDAGTDMGNTEDCFGVVDANYEPKPLTAAVKTLLAQCKGYKFAGIIASPSATMHILGFQNAFSTLLVLWSEDATGTSHPVTFKKTPKQAVDYLGNAIAPTAAGGQKCTVGITDTPVYLVFPRSLAATVLHGKK